MKRFIIKLLALGLPFVLFLGAYQFMLSSVHPDEYSAKKDLLERRAHEVEVLVMGSSHAYYGIMPDELGRPAFNLAAVSQSLFYDRALVEKYLDQLPALKMVILPVSYFTPGYQVDDSIEHWRGHVYYYVYGQHNRNWHKDCSARNFFAYYLYDTQLGGPGPVFTGKVRDCLGDYDLSGGWTNRVMSTTSQKPLSLAEDGPVALKRHRVLMKPPHYPENEAILEDLVKRLKSRGIKPILISMPTTHYYRDGMDAALHQRMQDILNRVSSENGIPYLDYEADPRFVDADFYNSDHLNLAGARKFSRLLGAEAVTPAIGQPQQQGRM